MKSKIKMKTYIDYLRGPTNEYQNQIRTQKWKRRYMFNMKVGEEIMILATKAAKVTKGDCHSEGNRLNTCGGGIRLYVNRGDVGGESWWKR